jgi:hypothetical protein
MARGGVKGNKGGGRKSAYQELADATEAFKLFFDNQDQEEIERRITSGKFSLADRFKLNAMEGSTPELIGALKKAVPDNVDITTKGKITLSFDPIFNAAASETERGSRK